MSDLKETPETQIAAEREPITFAEFLESVPPSQTVTVTNLWGGVTTLGKGTTREELKSPQLQLHCTSDQCNGLRFFRYDVGDKLLEGDNPKHLSTYITYLCANCRRTRKMYSLRAVCGPAGGGTCYKFGEAPAYGPPTPARLIRLFGNDREIFLKGRQCETHGLGIGAFVYYRRVVENHKNQILDEIIRVSKKIGVPQEMLTTLEAAKEEVQFSKALASVRDAIPQLFSSTTKIR